MGIYCQIHIHFSPQFGFRFFLTGIPLQDTNPSLLILHFHAVGPPAGSDGSRPPERAASPIFAMPACFIIEELGADHYICRKIRGHDADERFGKSIQPPPKKGHCYLTSRCSVGSWDFPCERPGHQNLGPRALHSFFRMAVCVCRKAQDNGRQMRESPPLAARAPRTPGIRMPL